MINKNIEIINRNASAIAVLKVKQYAIAVIAGMGGSKIQEILSKIVF